MSLNQIGFALARACAILAVGLAAGLSLSLASTETSVWIGDTISSLSGIPSMLRPVWGWLALFGLFISFIRHPIARFGGLAAMIVGSSLTLYALLAFINGADTL